jgi:hypothetical protein
MPYLAAVIAAMLAGFAVVPSMRAGGLYPERLIHGLVFPYSFV